MIKFFQKLKAKKGFTLVELIVVIAIIGVLAAILIPTMLGYVTSSRVQSANSTAAEIKNMVNNFITDMDTKGYTFDRSGNHYAVISVGVSASGTEGTGGGASIPGETGFDSTAFKGDDGDAINAAFVKKVSDDFNFTKAYAVAYIENGKVVGCAYSPDGDSTFTGSIELANFKENLKNFDGWDDNQNGIMGGLIIGTAPQLNAPLAGSSDES